MSALVCRVASTKCLIGRWSANVRIPCATLTDASRSCSAVQKALRYSYCIQYSEIAGFFRTDICCLYQEGFDLLQHWGDFCFLNRRLIQVNKVRGVNVFSDSCDLRIALSASVKCCSQMPFTDCLWHDSHCPTRTSLKISVLVIINSMVVHATLSLRTTLYFL